VPCRAWTGSTAKTRIERKPEQALGNELFRLLEMLLDGRDHVRGELFQCRIVEQLHSPLVRLYLLLRIDPIESLGLLESLGLRVIQRFLSCCDIAC
jgi:hypothetical protein